MYGITSGSDPLKFKFYIVYSENNKYTKEVRFCDLVNFKSSKLMYFCMINFKISRNVFYPKILEILMVKFYLIIFKSYPTYRSQFACQSTKPQWSEILSVGTFIKFIRNSFFHESQIKTWFVNLDTFTFRHLRKKNVSFIKKKLNQSQVRSTVSHPVIG